MDILESINIAHLLYQVCNLTQLQLKRKLWSLKRCCPLECYSVCVLLISVCPLFYSLYFEENFMKGGVGVKVAVMQLFGIRLAHIFSVLETMVRRNEQKKFYEKVQDIDRVFKCSLNVSMDNRSLRRKMLKNAVVMLIIYISSESFMLGTIILSGSKQFTIFLILYLVPYIICSLRYFQISTAVSIIKQRLERLISTLEVVNLNISGKSPASSKLIQPRVAIFETTERMNRLFDTENSELWKLLVIRDLYNRLWELTTILNRCVGISVLINVANDFLSITTNCYWMFLQFENYSATFFDILQTVSGAIWTMSHLYNVIELAKLCGRMVHIIPSFHNWLYKGKNVICTFVLIHDYLQTSYVASSLHKIQIDSKNGNHIMLIKQFSLQLLHQKIIFTGAGFFNVDCTLLYKIIGATTTYLVILIQFHMSEKDSKP